MKLILQFLKPHWKLTVLTVLLAVIDVGGSLFIPTLAAHLLNQGTSGVAFEELLTTGLQMGRSIAVLQHLRHPGRLRLRHPCRPHRQGHARRAL